MKCRIVWIATLCLGLLTVVGCTGFNEVHNGQTVNATVGKNFDVTLKSNPTTGYQWQVVVLDESMIKQIGTPQYDPESGLVGAGGTETFTFQPLKPGKTKIGIAYARIWETNKKPAETYSLTVDISE